MAGAREGRADFRAGRPGDPHRRRPPALVEPSALRLGPPRVARLRFRLRAATAAARSRRLIAPGAFAPWLHRARHQPRGKEHLMQSRRLSLGLAVAGIAVRGLFIVLSGDDESDSARPPPPRTTTTGGPPKTTTTQAPNEDRVEKWRAGGRGAGDRGREGRSHPHRVTPDVPPRCTSMAMSFRRTWRPAKRPSWTSRRHRGSVRGRSSSPRRAREEEDEVQVAELKVAP